MQARKAAPVFWFIFASLLAITFSHFLVQTEQVQAQTGRTLQLNNGRVTFALLLGDDNRLNQMQLIRDDGRVMSNSGQTSPFEITFQNIFSGRRIILNNQDFTFNITESDNNALATLIGTANREGLALQLKLRYRLAPNGNFVTGWMELNGLPEGGEWVVKYAAPLRWSMPGEYSAPPLLKEWYYLTKILLPRGMTAAPLLTSNAGYGLYFFMANLLPYRKRVLEGGGD
jgi:hypothetical protein